MPSFKKRHGRWEIRFKKTGRSPQEKSESLPLNIAKTELKRIEGEMNAAYHGDWDPWKQSWKEFKNGDPIGTYSVRQAKNDYICFCKRNNRWNSESTIRNNEEQLVWFVDFVGANLQTAQITNHHLASFLARKDVSPGTEKTYYRNIKAFINWLKEKGYNSNEFPYRPSKQTDHSILYFTEDELDNLVASFKKHRSWHSMDYVAIWKFMFYQCVRAGEVFKDHKDGTFGIRPVDITGNRIRIYGKGNKIREVPIVAPIKEMILQKTEQAKSPTDYIFDIRSKQGCFSQTKHFLRQEFPKHRHVLNLHSLRRGGAVYWTEKGKPLAAIKELLGHSSIKTTEKHYARFQPDGMMSVFG